MVIQLFWWREQDLNLRPSGYEPDELPDCSIPRYVFSCLKWCLGRDLNPHVHRGHGILSPVRLPIPPPRHISFKHFILFVCKIWYLSRTRRSIPCLQVFVNTFLCFFLCFFLFYLQKLSNPHFSQVLMFLRGGEKLFLIILPIIFLIISLFFLCFFSLYSIIILS